jgi:hypothetical protein
MRHYKLKLLATNNPAECGSLPLSGSRSSGGSAAPGVTLHPLGAAPLAYVRNDVPTTADVSHAPARIPSSSVVPVGSPASTRPSPVPHPTKDLAHVPQPTVESSVPISASTASLAPSLLAGDTVTLSDLAAPSVTVVTHLRNNITKPRVPIDGTILYNPTRQDFFDAPSSYRATLVDDQWCVAMQSKFTALQQNATWTLVPKPSGQNIISCKWIFKIKEKSDGSVDKLKARLVAWGFNYMETFSPIIKLATVHLVLSIAVSHSWDIHQINISNAFLHGTLDESTYM